MSTREADAVAERKHERVRRMIRASLGAPGSALPSETALAEMYDVSRPTIRHALKALEDEGLITSSQGSVRTVRPSGRITHYATDALADAPTGAAERAGREPDKEFSMRIAAPPPAIASRLGVPADTLVVIREVRQVLDGEPWSVEASYYPHDLAAEAGLDTPHAIEQGAIRTLADAGHAEVAYVDEVSDEAADEDAARELAVPVGFPLLVQLRTGATDRRITRVTRYLRLGRSLRLVWEIGDQDGLDVIRAARSPEGDG
jgi:GntR family transcriptional regulator